ncbi:MAG: hypothetical protein PSX36_07440 [bacterium]|nr:hypothetical protein [bacterium]
MKKIINICLFTFVSVILLSSCKKKKADPHTPPIMEFKTGAGYTTGDKTVAKSDTLLVGITATKTEDNLKSYNVSFIYDGGSTSTTFYNYLLTADEANGYSKDIKIVARNSAGNEKWIFSVVDRDGNITQKTINLVVN